MPDVTRVVSIALSDLKRKLRNDPVPAADEVRTAPVDICVDVPEEFTESFVEDVARSPYASASAGNGIASLTVPLQAVRATGDSEPSDAEIDSIVGFIGSACVLHAELCVLQPPRVQPHHRSSDRPASDDESSAYDRSINRTYHVMDRLIPAAERAGLTLAGCAPHCGAFLSPVELRELIDRIGSANVGVCIDLPQLALVGSFGDWTAILPHRIAAVRVESADPRVPEQLPHWRGRPPLVIHDP